MAAAEPVQPPDDFSHALETMRRALGVPGMAAAVVSDGRVVFAEGFGYADVDDGVPAEPSTPFGLASVTKPIAASLIMGLVEDGLIDLDAPVASYGVTVLGDRGVTVRHLLTHTSEGEPGTRHEYNGDRYGLLGGVIEGATGRTFAELLSERILVPVGMDDTALNPLNNWGGPSVSGLEDFGRVLGWGENFEHYPDVYRRLATPYQFGDRYEIVPGMYHLFHNPAAGLVSSVSDLAAFDIALDRGEIVTQETLTEMTSPAVPTRPGRTDLNYGLGWYVVPVTVGLLAIRAHVIERAEHRGYGSAVRRGALAEFVTWSVGFAVFLPLTFLADDHVLSTVPAPSSPFFGAMLAVIAIVAVLVLSAFDSVAGRFGYRLWPGPSSSQGAGSVLRLPTLHDSKPIAVAAAMLFVVVLAVSIALFG